MSSRSSIKVRQPRMVVSRRRRPLPPPSGDRLYWALKSFLKRTQRRKNGPIWGSESTAKVSQRWRSAVVQLPLDPMTFNGPNLISEGRDLVRRAPRPLLPSSRWIVRWTFEIESPGERNPVRRSALARCAPRPQRPLDLGSNGPDHFRSLFHQMRDTWASGWAPRVPPAPST